MSTRVRITEEMVVSVRHNPGVYSLPGLSHPGGVWHEPTTTIFVDGEAMIQIEGDDSDVRVWRVWRVERGRVVEDATRCTSGRRSHYKMAYRWTLGMAASTPAAVLLQAAGLFAPGEFIDEVASAA